MRYAATVVFTIILVGYIQIGCYAQCLPKIITLPPAQIRGDLVCEDSNLPIDPGVIELIVDGIPCPAADWEFTYPFLSDGFYKVEFWIDTNRSHVVSICVEGTCDAILNTAGFSDDGIHPFSCVNTADFPQYEIMIIKPVILPAAQTLPLSGTNIILLFLLFSALLLGLTPRLQ